MRPMFRFIAATALGLCALGPRSFAQIGTSVPLKGNPVPEYDSNKKLVRTVVEDENGTRFVTEYGPDGKPASRRVELTKDPKVLARLEQQEKSLIAAVDAAKDNGLGGEDDYIPNDKEDKLAALANFYLFTTHDMEKAAATIAKLPPDHSFALHTQLIFYNFSLLPAQKAAAYKKLLDLYPGNTSIEGFMRDAQTEADR